MRSPITISTDLFVPSHGPPPPPGEMLLQEFMKPYGLTQQALADAMRVTRVRVNEIINGRRGITADSALRLARVFSTSVDLWLKMQLSTDLYAALHSSAAKQIAAIRPVKVRRVHRRGARARRRTTKRTSHQPSAT